MSPATYDLLTILLAQHRVELNSGRAMARTIHGSEHPVTVEYARHIAVADAAQEGLIQYLPQSVAA